MPTSEPPTDEPGSKSIQALLAAGDASFTSDGLLVRSPRTGEVLLVAALTDLDGTANDEHVVERDRLATLGPATEAFSRLAKSGVVTGICTARSLGEARNYRTHLGVSGPLIAENGAIVEFPDGLRKTYGDIDELRRIADWASATLGREIPDSTRFDRLQASWEREQRGQSPPYLGHPNLESLRMAADRRASCFLVGLDRREKALVTEYAARRGIFCFGELLHLIPAGASKGTALEALIDRQLNHAGTGKLQPVRIAQIVFGNGENDLSLFEKSLGAGGAAVLVGDATTSNGFHFDVEQHPVPPGTITVPGVSHGHAIQKSLPEVARFFAEHYGIGFSW